MNRLLVVIFSDATKAFEGRDALKSLNHDESIRFYGYALITKKADGTLVNEEDHRAGFNLLLGTSLKRLIAGLGKPSGVDISTGSKSAASAVDPDEARVVADFVNEVSEQLTANKFAVVAEIDEEWTPWVDLRMAELGGVVYRCPLSDVKHVADSAEVAAMKADLAGLKTEHARATAERKAKLLEKINQLDTKIQQHLQREKEQREVAESEAKAKADLLKTKASPR